LLKHASRAIDRGRFEMRRASPARSPTFAPLVWLWAVNMAALLASWGMASVDPVVSIVNAAIWIRLPANQLHPPTIVINPNPRSYRGDAMPPPRRPAFKQLRIDAVDRAQRKPRIQIVVQSLQ